MLPQQQHRRRQWWAADCGGKGLGHGSGCGGSGHGCAAVAAAAPLAVAAAALALAARRATNVVVGGAQKWEVLAWSHHDDRAVYLLLALVLFDGLHELVHTDGERTGRGVRCPNTPLSLARAWESTLACR